MNPVNTEIEELKAIVEKMTPGEWCWSYVGSKDNGYIVGSACDEHGEPRSGFIDIDYATMIDPVMIGEHEAATVNYGDPAGIVALKNKAIPLIETLLKRAEDAEAVAWNAAIDAAFDACCGLADGIECVNAIEALKKPEAIAKARGKS